MAVVRDFTALLSNYSWSGTGLTNKPAFVTYSFETAAQSYVIQNDGQTFANSFQGFTANEQAMARQALNQWASISGITFIEVPAGEGMIGFGKYDFNLDPGMERFGGYAYYPSFALTSSYAYENSIGGDVFINTRYPTSMSLLLHEIGHALGFKHPFDGNTTLATDLDQASNTVMSYTGTSGVLGIFDTQAAQYVYGGASSDGSQVSAWSWDSANTTLYQWGGGAGETIRGVAGRDVIYGQGGADIIGGFAGDDYIDGGDGNDSLFGGAGHDRLRGGTGDDTIDGDDSSTGAQGFNDWIDYSDTTLGVTVNLANQFNSNGRWVNAVGTEAGYDVLRGIESVYGGSGNDTITGSALSNVVFALAGNDVLSGGDGDDHLVGGAGNDTITGGNGTDTAYYTDATSGVIVDLRLTTAQTVGGGLGNDTLNGVENLYGSSFDDQLFGNGLANVLTGGDGYDHLTGGAGADRLDGGNGFDFARYDTATGGVYARLDFAAANTGDAAGDVYIGIEGLVGSNFLDVMIGDYQINYLYGLGGEDWLYGLEANDVLYGGLGNDWLQGGTGADYMDGADGFDFARYDLAQGPVTARLDAPQYNTGEAAGDSLYNLEGLVGSQSSDVLVGNDLDNQLYGLAGADTIYGLGGSDFVTGGRGSDTYFTGEGSDTIYIPAGDLLNGEQDRIYDFADGQDTLLFQGIASASVSIIDYMGGTLIYLPGANGGQSTVFLDNISKAAVLNDLLFI